MYVTTQGSRLRRAAAALLPAMAALAMLVLPPAATPAVAAAAAKATAATPVDINAASEKDLETLPGVGVRDGQEDHRRPALQRRRRPGAGRSAGQDDR